MGAVCCSQVGLDLEGEGKKKKIDNFFFFQYE